MCFRQLIAIFECLIVEECGPLLRELKEVIRLTASLATLQYHIIVVLVH